MKRLRLSYLIKMVPNSAMDDAAKFVMSKKTFFLVDDENLCKVS